MNPPQPAPAAPAQRQFSEALAVMATALEIRVTAAELARDPLSEPTAERMRALLADPDLRCARAAAKRLLTEAPEGSAAEGRC